MTASRKIFICQGTGCLSSASADVYEALRAETARLSLEGVEIDYTGCHGFCEQGPITIVEPEGIFYTKVQVEDA
ncbi:MAG TPA: NADH-quinone oxidoreductase subunit F, partial [Firmicutes bacterium]|nr:NADH-quinone oxidoreductase subunit F [Bacillota bacterium]